MNSTEVTHEDLMIEINHRNIEIDNLLTLKENRELSVLNKNMTHFVDTCTKKGWFRMV